MADNHNKQIFKKLKANFDKLYSEYSKDHDMTNKNNREAFLSMVVDMYTQAVNDTFRVTEDKSFSKISVHKQLIKIFANWEKDNYIKLAKESESLHDRIKMSELQNIINKQSS
jgi:capsid protein